jgi:hypothetical protein
MDTRENERSRSAAFVALLIEDVIAARERLGATSGQTARRDVVRTSLAAIEGMTWIAREHVRVSLAALDCLTTFADLALKERTYAVTESGKVIEQTRGLPLLTTIRLVVSQAKLISPEIDIEFSAAGWSDLRHAISVRNRITHPKPEQDLTVNDNDLAAVGSAVAWLVATLDYVMASTNMALTWYNDQLRETVRRLSAGDPDALAEYHAALQDAAPEV